MVSGPKMFSFQLRGEVIDASVGPSELGVKGGGEGQLPPGSNRNRREPAGLNSISRVQ